MDDDRTQETLDTLADLFLTGTRPAASRPEPNPKPVRTPPPVRLAPKLQARANQRPAHEPGPALKLHPAAQDEPAPQATPQAPAEAQAPQAQPPAPAAPDNTPAAYVEAVMLGNLPGLAGPWLTQYAQLLAEQDGPVAILHVTDEQLRVDLVQPMKQASDLLTDTALPEHADELQDLLDQLTQHAHTPVRTVLVHLEASTHTPTLDWLMRLDDWTFLAGSDDAAVLSTYQALKNLHDANPAAAAKRVGLMVLGSDEPAALAASHKLNQTAESFLRTPIQLLGFLQRMSPANARPICEFPTEHTPWPQTLDWLTQLPNPEQDEAPAARIEPAPPVSPPAPEPAPAWATMPIPEAVAASDPEPAASPTVQPQPIAAPQPTAQPTPTAPAAPPVAPAAEPDLPALLTAAEGPIPAGVPLEAVCPQQPLVQLVLDEQGQLHLTRRHDPKRPNIDGLQAAVLDLLEARRWVTEHLDLLRLTQRQCVFHDNAQPTLHLFTDRADWATGLAQRLGAALKLHLLKPVTLQTESGWFCTPLN